MASVENLKNEIAEKQTEIETTQEKLAQSQAEEDEQYELMRQRLGSTSSGGKRFKQHSQPG